MVHGTHSDFIIYIDESGDHGLAPQAIDPTYPVFVLAACIFEKKAYVEEVVPEVQRLKFRYFGHDCVVLHGSDIKRQRPPYGFLRFSDKRSEFMAALNAMIERSPFTLIAAVIHKERHVRQYAHPLNPYEITLEFCLERAYFHLNGEGAAEQVTHVVVESRGKKEDDELELAFRRICDFKSWTCFDIIFTSKQANSSGLQIADLVATPIGRHTLNPEQPNRAYEIVETKFRRDPRGSYKGWGLKAFP